MVGRLAAVTEESMDCSTAAYPPRSVYCDRIRKVAVSGVQIRSTICSRSQSGHSGSSCSTASNSYPSNNSGCSSGSASDAVLEYSRAQEELSRIARQMVSDGYTQRMVQAFHVAPPAPAQALGNGGGQDSALETCFSDLDVAWVLQIGRQEHGSLQQVRLQDQSASRDLVERWIRSFTVIVQNIIELVSSRHEMMVVARFGKAIISKMLVFVDAILLSDLKAEKLQAVLDMYICVYNASCMLAPVSRSAEAQGMFNETSGSLSSARDRLKEAISSTTMEEMSTVMDDGDDRLWAIEIKHGGGGIHKNTRLGMNFIMSMFKAANLAQNSEMCPENLGGLLDSMICYLKIFLFRKSQLCTDIGLRYLFQLNYSYFISQECASSFSLDATTTMLGSPAPQSLLAPELTGECNQYMARYLDASWGHVLSCIPRSHFTRPIHRWINISSLTKFDSAFHQTYQAQKFWKVPDPLLRDMLRRVIMDRVVSSYRHYLQEHPELEKHIGRESSSPKVLEDMLGELFEG